ncbi:hypothetical protein HPB51_012809 [Rhipicephalus microplus]|uniref:Uncharacterized protein n=1 Tax=Rhipicephalus microplus TaxID=6941 RepID=A0A9J6D9X5_RHIMP|nr:hypothetical protein HPB51_012809 [Rhipicephalus microplus]
MSDEMAFEPYRDTPFRDSALRAEDDSSDPPPPDSLDFHDDIHDHGTHHNMGSGLGSMSATPHAHTIRLPFVPSLTLTCLLTFFNGPPCVADGDPMFAGHQPLHRSTTAVFIQPDPGSESDIKENPSPNTPSTSSHPSDDIIHHCPIPPYRRIALVGGQDDNASIPSEFL